MSRTVLDTDIGSNIDDALCLAYLLARRDAGLVAVTTVGDQAERRAALAATVCARARRRVAVAAGAGSPLAGGSHWLAPTDDVHVVEGADEPPVRGGAIEVLRSALSDEGGASIVAVGPLTNLAELVLNEPEVVGRCTSLSVMGGSYGVGSAPAEAVERNLAADPEAARVVLGAPWRRLVAVGLDVTRGLQLDAARARALFGGRLRAPVATWLEAWLARCGGVTLNDPLAAIALMEPRLVRLERGRIAVEGRDGPEPGRTRWARDPAGPHQLVAEIDAAAVVDHLAAILSEHPGD